MRSGQRTTKYHWQGTTEKKPAEWPLYLLILTMGLIWEVAAERKSSFQEKVSRKKKKFRTLVLEGPSSEENAEWLETCEAVGSGQRLMIRQKDADLMTFTAQNKVILSLGCQCVVWN